MWCFRYTLFIFILLFYVKITQGIIYEGFEMTSDKIRIALFPGATFSDLMEILQKHIHFLFLREVNIGPYLYYLLKVNIETRDLIYVYNQWFDEDLVSLRQEPKVTAVEVEVEYLMDDNMYDSEVQQLWNLNGSITPSQNIPITWERKSYTGKDQTIAFVELEYMQTNHRDLVNQVVQDNTINWDYSNNSPYPTSASPYVHGTYVAGVAIAQGGNDFCLVGVAPDATGIAISIGRKATDSDCASANTHRLGNVDIYNESWGPKKFTAKFMHVPVCEFAMSEGGTKGRKGKGSIYVMSAGNDGPRFNTNTFSLRNSIYAIVVSAVNARRELPSYASVGSSIMVVAYGGDDNLKVNLLNPVSECSKMDSGTSIASPTVSGVIALVLEARPDLSWRDVQHLIVCTANTDLKGTLVEWERNGAGFLTHPRLGFGLIDAYNMVSLAEQWMLVPKQLSCSQSKRSEVTITGRFRSASMFIDCNSQPTCQNCGCQIRYLEHIKVKVTFSWNGERWFNAAYRGQVELYLISPRGTKSYILTNRPADRLQPETFTWEFKSVQSWGENPCGTFLLSFGTRSNDVTVRLESWHLTLYGTMDPPPSLQAYYNKGCIS